MNKFKMIAFALLLLSINIVAFCQQTNQNNLISIDSTNKQNNFLQFWSDFRLSVIESDSLRILNYINFPLNVFGREDKDPVYKINKNDFPLIFNYFLSNKGDSYNSINYNSNLDFIKSFQNIESYIEYIYSTDFHMIEDMVFQKIKGKWKLTFIYLNTKSLKNYLIKYQK